MNKKLFYFLPIFILFYSCVKDDDINDSPDVDIKSDLFVKAEVVKKISSEDITAIYKGSMPTGGGNQPTIKLDAVTVYKITYKTTYPGKTEKILASGALIVPDNVKNNHIVSYQHGTIINPTEIPSLFGPNTQNHFTALFGGLGFYVSVPDYLGYGASADQFHIYEHGESLATASYDMLLASREFLASQDEKLGGKLFLTGYSEGGYATMALHQHIEEIGDLAVTASAPGAGSYNKWGFAQEILSKNEPVPFIQNYLWVLASYNSVYNINKPWSYYLNEPYASAIDLTNPLSVFTANIDTNPANLFTQSFKDEILNDMNTPLTNAIKDNNRFDWKANGEVRLYYGTEDNFVYPANSISAYNAMKAKGTNVTSVPIEGKDHFTAVDTYAANVLTWFYIISFL